MGKLEKTPAWQLTKVTNLQKGVIAEARKEGKTIHFCVVNGPLLSQEFWSHSFKNTKVESYSR